MNPSEQITTALHRYTAAVYEACEPSLSPWPDDPDAGELRIVSALDDVAELHKHTDYDQFGRSTNDPALAHTLYGRRCAECGTVKGEMCPTLLVINGQLVIIPVNEGGPSTG